VTAFPIFFSAASRSLTFIVMLAERSSRSADTAAFAWPAGAGAAGFVSPFAAKPCDGTVSSRFPAEAEVSCDFMRFRSSVARRALDAVTNAATPVYDNPAEEFVSLLMM